MVTGCVLSTAALGVADAAGVEDAGEGVAVGLLLADGLAAALGACDAAALLPAWSADSEPVPGPKPSLGSRRKATRPIAKAATPTARIGIRRRAEGVATVRWTPCRADASGIRSNSSRAYLVMVNDVLADFWLTARRRKP